MTRSATESKKAPRGRRRAGRLGDGAVEHVGHGGEHQQDEAEPQRAVGDRDGGADGHHDAEQR